MLTRLLPGVLIIVTLGAACAEDDPVSMAPTDNTGTETTAPSASQTQADLQSAYNDFLGKYGLNPISDSLFDDMLKDNAKKYLDYENAHDAAVSAGSQPGGAQVGMSLPGGWGSTTIRLGGTITDLGGAPASYPQPTDTVHFIDGSGPNRLGKVDEKMKRVSGWLNKHTCGGFDWAAQFNFMFKLEVLKEYVKQLGEGVVAAAPMALLGAFSPQLAEAVKHLKLIAGMDLSASKMDCQQIQNALTGGLDQAKWGIGYSKCLQDNADAGIDAAVKTCQDGGGAQGWMADPAGGLFQTMNAGAATAGAWVDKVKNHTSDWFGNMFSDNASSATSQAASSAGAATAQNPNAPADQADQNAGAAQGALTGQASRYFNAVGSGVSSVMKDLFGTVQFSATGAMEIGRKRMDLFNVQFRVHGNQLRDKLTEQLDDHYSELTATVLDGSQLAQSYRNLHTWTLHTRGGEIAGTPAWLRDPYAALSAKDITVTVKGKDGKDTPISPYDQRITNKTFDNLSVLRNLQGYYSANSAMYSQFEREYGLSKFIDALAFYELYLYIYEGPFQDAKQSFISKQGTTSPADNSGGKADVADKLKPMLDSTEKDLTQMIGQYQATILLYLPKINAFDASRVPGVPAAAGPSAPEVVAPSSPGLPGGGY